MCMLSQYNKYLLLFSSFSLQTSQSEDIPLQLDQIGVTAWRVLIEYISKGGLI